ncbi:MAG: hypothetical protein JJE42_02755 [Burkholderiales bacterium]|nr:hypothetical protein [Burkholderiales bacterium]
MNRFGEKHAAPVDSGYRFRHRLRRQVASLEDDKAALEGRVRELESEASQSLPAPAEQGATPYVGLKSLMMAQEEANGTGTFEGHPRNSK